MTHIFSRIATAVITTLLFSISQATEFNRFQVDKSHVEFTFTQMNVPVDGSFRRFNGLLRFDPKKPEAAHASLDIELASIDAGSQEANDEVAGRDWFNARSFPRASFSSTSVRPLNANMFEIIGTIVIKGRARDITIPVTFRQEGNIGFLEGAFTLKRADFGVGEGIWADFDTVANNIQIKFRLVVSANP